MPTITITTPKSEPQRFEVSPNRETVTLGRSSKSDIKISCESVSGTHATIRKLQEGYVLRDMGSTNGTKLQGKRVSEIHLEGGQDIKLGDVVFSFELEAGSGRIEPKTKTQQSKEQAAPKSKTEPQERPQSESEPLTLGLTLMGGGLIVLGFVVLIGMDAIKAIADREQSFIVGGSSLILAGLLCLGSILFLTGKIKMPKLVVHFGDEEDDEEDEDEKREKKRKKRDRKKSRKKVDDEEDEDSDDDENDDPDEKDVDSDKDFDSKKEEKVVSDDEEELGKAPKGDHEQPEKQS